MPLWLLAVSRYVFVLLEQPSSSKWVVFPYMEYVLQSLQPYLYTYRTFLSGAYIIQKYIYPRQFEHMRI